MARQIARVGGEFFDADQVSLPCETCGLNEYVCECEVESWPAPKLTADEIAQRDARIADRIAEVLEAKAERESGWAAAEIAALKRRAA